MIDFNQFPMHKKPYADNTLRCMPRKELIAYIRDIEHNYETLYWFYQNAVNANLEKFKDFERVVRCKDCKHRFEGKKIPNCCEVLMEMSHWLVEIPVEDEWHCGSGERKEE